MTNYARMYRFGITPWERYTTAAASSIAVLLDREETGRSRPLGRALDLGCGRGLYNPELARRGCVRAGQHRGPGLADEQDRAAVVPAGPAGLEQHCPVPRCQGTHADPPYCTGREAVVIRQTGSDQVFMWLREGPSCGFG
jgi:hypothetical protein